MQNKNISSQFLLDPEFEIKKMFGREGLFVKGKLFLVFLDEAIAVKLDEQSLHETKALPGTRPFDPSGKGRAFKQWLEVPLQNQDQYMSLAQAAYQYVKKMS